MSDRFIMSASTFHVGKLTQFTLLDVEQNIPTIVYIQMRHVILEFMHSKQSEEDTILKVDETVTEAEREKQGTWHPVSSPEYCTKLS